MPFNEDQLLPSPVTTSVVPQSDYSWWGLMGTVLVFLLMLLVALWIIRRLSRANLRSMNAPWARVLDRQVLGGQQNLYLVEVAGQLQVLAGSDHHLVKISEINDPTIAAEILEEITQRPIERVEGWASSVRKLWPRPKRPVEDFSVELERILEEVEKR